MLALLLYSLIQGGDILKQSIIFKLQGIVEYMNQIGWEKKVRSLGPFEDELNEYSKAMSKAFVDLAVSSIDIAEAKYKGYNALIDNANADNPESFDTITDNNLVMITEKETERQEVEDRISELMFLFKDLQERIKETGDLPQNIPSDFKSEGKSEDECA